MAQRNIINIREWDSNGRLELWQPPEPEDFSLFAEKLTEIKHARLRRSSRQEWTGQATWIHIPRNEMALCEEVLLLLCHDSQYEYIIDTDRWEGQVQVGWSGDDKTKEAIDGVPHMSATAFKSKLRVEGTEWLESETGTIETEILYLPFLNTELKSDHMRNTAKRYDSYERHRNKKRGIHPRRGLDEIGYDYHSRSDLERRNRDQVMTKFLKHESNKVHRSSQSGPPQDMPVEHELVVADQLWLWILDSDTIVTSFPAKADEYLSNSCVFPGSTCMNLHCECLIVERINKTQRTQTAQQMSSHIIHQCSRLLLESRGKLRRYYYEGPGVVRDSIVDVFRKYIAQQRATCADIFDTFEIEVIRRSEPQTSRVFRSNDHLNIESDIHAVGETRDVIEELEMILHVTELQLRVLESAKYGSIWKLVNEIHQQLGNLRNQAKDVHEMLFKTLELKQTQLSIHQSDLTIHQSDLAIYQGDVALRQSRTVLVLTIVTIVFLPLSFISSIFGMNASELTAGSPVDLGRIFAYMFPISFALSVLVLLWALWYKEQNSAPRLNRGISTWVKRLFLRKRDRPNHV
ncbi:hypothetical protein PMIN04_003272 [Paraphaeosphaeria minitans]